MIMLKDATYTEIFAFLDAVDHCGKAIPTKVQDHPDRLRFLPLARYALDFERALPKLQEDLSNASLATARLTARCAERSPSCAWRASSEKTASPIRSWYRCSSSTVGVYGAAAKKRRRQT